MTKLIEIWKQICPCYEISSFGNVRSLDQTVKRIDGVILHIKGRNLKTQLSPKGYRWITIRRYGNQIYGVHRHVAKAFIPNPENKPHINHKNAIKTDNRVENLEWCTPLENRNHAKMMGLIPSVEGEKNPAAKLKAIDIIKIRSLFKNGMRQKKIAIRYGFGENHIGKICRRELWDSVK